MQARCNQPHWLRLRPGCECGLGCEALVASASRKCCSPLCMPWTLPSCLMSAKHAAALSQCATASCRCVPVAPHCRPQHITRTDVKGGVPPDPMCTQSEAQMTEVGGLNAHLMGSDARPARVAGRQCRLCPLWKLPAASLAWSRSLDPQYTSLPLALPGPTGHRLLGHLHFLHLYVRDLGMGQGPPEPVPPACQACAVVAATGAGHSTAVGQQAGTRMHAAQAVC